MKLSFFLKYISNLFFQQLLLICTLCLPHIVHAKASYQDKVYAYNLAKEIVDIYKKRLDLSNIDKQSKAAFFSHS